MKRRSFLQLLAAACGASIFARRAPAEMPVATPAAVPFDMHKAVVDFANRESKRFAEEFDARRGMKTLYRDHGAWTLNPDTHQWENTFVFLPCPPQGQR